MNGMNGAPLDAEKDNRVPQEPSRPHIATAVPGPATLGTKSALDGITDARAVQLVVDYEKSTGNL